jgi:hypothetical protein
MRISDLLACDVYDHEDRCIGRVRDVRLVMDGPVRGALAMLRVDALIVGGDAVAGRLGYLRSGVRGPALIGALMGRLERRALTIPARQVIEWDVAARRLRLAAQARLGDDPDA